MPKPPRSKDQPGKLKPADRPTLDAAQACEALHALENPEKAAFLAGFFKTGKGQYAEGDRFLGITVPQVRLVARQFRELHEADCEVLLQSPYNEVRLLALLVLTAQYAKGDEAARESVCNLYLRNRRRVNNWNLVDGSASQILGEHLVPRKRDPLYELAGSPSLWDRRIGIIATFAFIRRNDFADTLRISKLLLKDPEDLMHKACGWMLREAGKRDQDVLTGFLRQHCRTMPRTMLRYAIEKFPPEQRQAWLDGRTQP